MLDIALRLFAERAYGGTPLQAVAEELGLSKNICVLLGSLANCRVVLEAYLAIVAEYGQVDGLLIGDPTASTLLAAIRFRAQRARLRELLAVAGRPEVGPVQATGCLGAVETAAFDLPPTDIAANGRPSSMPP